MDEEKITLKELSEFALVIGGGMAGITAALDLANQKRKVYLVEKSPSIGESMANMARIFPTDESYMSLLEPLLVECAKHPNIDILTLSEIKKLSGSPGNFTVKIERHPRYVDEEKCNGCSLCEQVCKVRVPNEFEQNLGARKAIYVPFPQAVPLIYTIDIEHCIKCGQCQAVCGRNAINYEMQKKEIEIHVGSIIVATGGEDFKPSEFEKYGYSKYPNVLASTAFERLISPLGPTRGKILRPSDGKLASNIVFIQCAGAMDHALPYCFRHCCNNTLKQAMASKKEKGVLGEVSVFYKELRLDGKNAYGYLEEAKDYGVNYVHGIPEKIEQKENGNLLVYSGSNVIETDLVVLATAITPDKDAKQLSETLGISLNKFGFITELDQYTQPVDTSKPSIYACGNCTGPKTLPDVVAQASGAAAKASLWLSPSIEEESYTKKEEPKEEKLRIGVFACNCGANIGRYLDLDKVVEYATKLPDVVHAEYNQYTCPAETGEEIKKTIKKHRINRLVVASCACCSFENFICSSCNHQRMNCKKNIMGIWDNPYPPEFVNIKEQLPWVHFNESENAQKKANDIIRAAVKKVSIVEPFYEKDVEVVPNAIVIGGGIAGMTAALNLAHHGITVHLVEKKMYLGGLIRDLDTVPSLDLKPDRLKLVREIKTLKSDDIKSEDFIGPITEKVEKEKNIKLHLSTTVKDVGGYPGNFSVILDEAGEEKNITAGIIIVASGAVPFIPSGYYGYGKYRNVFTQFELETMLKDDIVKKPKNVVMIQCVGAYEKDRKYCSNICCMMAIKNARLLKKKFPDASISIIHRGIRTTGNVEEKPEYFSYLGDIIRYDPQNPPEVREIKEDELEIVVTDSHGKKKKLKSDMLVLSTPLVPERDRKRLSKILRVPIDKQGFFLEAHPVIRPLDFQTEGIFVCSTANNPTDIMGSVSKALGAASRALRLLSKDRIRVKPTVVEVEADKCIGCAACVEVCPFRALYIKEEKSVVNEALCQGCGACIVSCPARAITTQQSMDEYYLAQIAELLAS